VSLWALVRVAAHGFSRHRMRALLTALGIIIGVGAFITMVALGSGASAKVSEQIASMGTNMLIAQGGTSNVGGVRGGSGTAGSAALTDDDVDAIGRQLPSVRWVAPLVSTNAQVVWGGMNWATSITGTTPEYLDIRAWSVASGSFFTQRDVQSASKVCVLGQTVSEQLFGDEDPVGQFVRVRALSCQVLGVLARKGQSQMGQDQDDLVIMPYTTVRRKIFNAGGAAANTLSRILMTAASSGNTGQTARAVQELLRQRHRTSEGQPDDPSVRDLTEFTKVAEETTRTTTLLLASIAAVSLVVGGIGIMNIMLVSVTERTREIGIRLAVGARGRDILAQFLLEAIFLTALGGVLGMVLGTAAARILSRAMDWPTLLGWQSYVLGFAFSTVVGVLFGFYPALSASRLDPIEALRYE
jgi:putative ABC transport system permease protein